MKFLISEHKAIVALLTIAGYEKEQFTFVKSRGWVNLVLEGKTVLAFHRENRTMLNDQKQWERKVSYALRQENEVTEYDSFQELKGAIAAGIKAFNKGNL